jgi:hypothetical protein
MGAALVAGNTPEVSRCAPSNFQTRDTSIKPTISGIRSVASSVSRRNAGAAPRPPNSRFSVVDIARRRVLEPQIGHPKFRKKV